jgi:hypothetical protein
MIEDGDFGRKMNMSLHYDEKGKFFTDYVSKESFKAIIQTNSNRIEGNLYLRSGERVSDMLNRSEKFIAVTDTEVFDLDGNKIYTCDFLSVNLDHVVWIMPIEEPSANDSKDALS